MMDPPAQYNLRFDPSLPRLYHDTAKLALLNARMVGEYMI